jgi:hypothetical protein
MGRSRNATSVARGSFALFLPFSFTDRRSAFSLAPAYGRMPRWIPGEVNFVSQIVGMDQSQDLRLPAAENMTARTLVSASSVRYP